MPCSSSVDEHMIDEGKRADDLPCEVGSFFTLACVVAESSQWKPTAIISDPVRKFRSSPLLSDRSCGCSFSFFSCSVLPPREVQSSFRSHDSRSNGKSLHGDDRSPGLRRSAFSDHGESAKCHGTLFFFIGDDRIRRGDDWCGWSDGLDGLDGAVETRFENREMRYPHRLIELAEWNVDGDTNLTLTVELPNPGSQ